MIYGIGIDTVEIERFHLWNTKKDTLLLRIFSAEEISYCRTFPQKSAERFAVRFAMREAFFKAYHAACYQQLGVHPTIPFLSLCRLVSISRTSQGAPFCKVPWDHPLFQNENRLNRLFPLSTHLSLSHTKHTATAIVILESAPKPNS